MQSATVFARPRALLLAAIAAWVTAGVLHLCFAPALGHDEAAFAVMARGDQVWLYRSLGTVWLAKLGIGLGGGDVAMRVASLLLGTTLLLAVYAVGKACFSDKVGAFAAAILAGAHPLVLRNAELLGDIPATACILFGIALVAGQVRTFDQETKARLAWRAMLGASTCFAAAFYFRYGSAPVIAIAMLIAIALWPRSLRSLPRLLAAGSLLSALLIPHLLYSRTHTGELLGALRVSSGMPRQLYVGDGLVTYFTSNPVVYYGALAAPAMIIGIGGLLLKRTDWKPKTWLAATALGQLMVLGLQSHAQPRYVYVAVALLSIVGVAAMVDFLHGIAQRKPTLHRRLAVAGCVLIIASWISVSVASAVLARSLRSHRTPLVAAANLIEQQLSDTAGSTGEPGIARDSTHKQQAPCFVVAKATTQLAWYSACRETIPGNATAEAIALQPTFLVSLPRTPIAPTDLALVGVVAELLYDVDGVKVWRLR